MDSTDNLYSVDMFDTAHSSGTWQSFQADQVPARTLLSACPPGSAQPLIISSHNKRGQEVEFKVLGRPKHSSEEMA